MKHIPVLLDEVVESLNLKKGGVYVDGTIGLGGHAQALANKVDCSLQIYGFDRDERVLKAVEAKNLNCVQTVHASYDQAYEILREKEVEQVDGILLDLGASSVQFDEPERGFSFKEGPLDMRFDVSRGNTAAEILNTYQKKDLARIIKEYGEEKFASRIAERIVQQREVERFSSTTQLVKLVESAIPRRAWPKKIHPATKTFQALRIEVNQELEQLKSALPKLLQLLKPGARIAIISFHSLEDRIVKRFFREAEKSCICPKEFPVCRCDKKQMIKIISKKPITPSKTEIKNNPRSRSAKLRVAERV